MRHEKDELWSGSTYLGRWKVISRPGAVIQAKVLEMSDEMRRRLTAEGVEYLPPPNLERFRSLWRLPRET
jgi:hypothetical protein